MGKIYTCNICGVTSEAAPFYKRVTSRCKECHKQKVRENRAAKADYYREYDAQRFQNDPRVKARHKRYQATAAGKASMQKARQKWVDENPDKRAAHTILHNAIKRGEVVKPESCSICGKADCRLEGHHSDYTKPLDVVWCCCQCHANIHREKEQ